MTYKKMILEYDSDVYWLHDEEGWLLMYTDKIDELAK